MKILVTGSTGLLGSNLLPFLAEKGFETAGLARKGSAFQCDLSDPARTAEALDEINPSAIVNLVAMTSVDGCEFEPELAFKINAASAMNLASWVKKNKKTKLLHISTDHLYNGPGPHKESPVDPVNVYAKTKLEAEKFITEADGAVLRTNFIGFHKHDPEKGYLAYVLRSIKNKTPLNVSASSFFSPLSIQSLCETILAVMQKHISGVFNAGSRNGMSKKEFVGEVASIIGCPIENITYNYKKPDVPRPDDMRMDSSLLEKTFAIPAPDMKLEIQRALTGAF